MSNLQLTSEITGLLGEKVTRIENDVPMKAMDTVHVGDKRLVISPSSQGPYRVELWDRDKQVRAMTVVTTKDAETSQCHSPQKYISTVRL